jgi:sigma-B regulation protein RsbQ
MFDPRYQQHNVNFVGAGTTTVVLAHGFGTNQTAWRRMLPWLAARHRVMLFDLAGCTAGNAAFFTVTKHEDLQDYASDLIRLLDRHGVRRCIYLGHSVSGMIGLLASIARPDLFQRLIMLASSPRYLNDGEYVGGFEQSDFDALYTLAAEDFEELAKGFAPLLVGDKNKAVIDEVATSFLAQHPAVTQRVARLFFEVDLRDQLTQSRVPSLIVQARDDIMVPMEVATYLEQHLPHSRLALLSSSGHLPHMTAPHRLIQLLEAQEIGRAVAA